MTPSAPTAAPQRHAPIFPFSAVVGADDMALALILTTVSPEVGGVLVRGEKGTAKSTMVRGLAAVLPRQAVVAGCRFGCDPDAADPSCPDGPHESSADRADRDARLVELPVGATEDRVVGSLDLRQALGHGVTAYEPGLLAAANRGILYVDEINLLHDHLVDLLLDAAAMGRCTVERDGVSVSHAARLVLVGTMNPEEGELRPQLLDRFGLTVEVAAPRDPHLRAEVVRRRLAFDADPAGFADRCADQQRDLRRRIERARTQVAAVEFPDEMLTTIARVCAGFEVDGMRADIVTARAAVAHAAWAGRARVTRADIRVAARLALPHRRRRNPFDEPGLDEDLLDQLLGDDSPEPDPDPDPEPDRDPDPEPGPDPDPQPPAPRPDGDDSDAVDAPRDQAPEPPRDQQPPPPIDPGPPLEAAPVPGGEAPPAASGTPYRARLLVAKGTGRGEDGRRSRAITSRGKAIGSAPRADGGLHLPATIRAAAPHQHRRGRESGRLVLDAGDLRRSVTQGRESNLILLCVDASGSMAARRRMEVVKTAVLSLLLDAYQRRDKVAMVTFRAASATVALPATSSVDVAARRLADLPHGGRTPLAEGLTASVELLRLERLRDPRRRPLLVVVTDGRATSGPDAVARAHRVAHHLRVEGVDSVVIDCETGRFRMGLAGVLATQLGAEHVPVDELGAGALVGTIRAHTEARTIRTTRKEVA